MNDIPSRANRVASIYDFTILELIAELSGKMRATSVMSVQEVQAINRLYRTLGEWVYDDTTPQ